MSSCEEVDDEFFTEQRELNSEGVPIQCYENIDCNDKIPESNDSCQNHICEYNVDKIIMTKGWNLVSVPLSEQLTAREFVESCGAAGVLWEFNEGSYASSPTERSIEPSKAFWAYILEEHELPSRKSFVSTRDQFRCRMEFSRIPNSWIYPGVWRRLYSFRKYLGI